MLLYILTGSICYSLINLDATAIAQTMISRPIVISPLIGSVLGLLNGDVASGARVGITIGVLLEFFWINISSLGSSVPSNAAISSVAATAVVCYLSKKAQIVGAGLCACPIEPYWITTGLIYGVCCGYAGGRTDTLIRALNAGLVNNATPFVEKGELSVINRLNLQAIGLSLAINTLLCAGLTVIGISFLPIILKFFPQEVLLALKNALYMFLLVCMGIALEAVMTKKSIFYFGAVWVIAAVIMAGR
ncbi:PTS sugar transporter subunit IIC [Candidatus Desantisbacteria bacterium]|nr:PTS sugar transporter subunit IIC [Candidatus Desantisbacteria bacterium]